MDFALGEFKEKKAWLLTLLENLSNDGRIKKIIKMTVENAVPPGENYASVINRIKMEVLLGNGRKSKKTFIMKTTPVAEGSQQFVQEFSSFKTEVKVYKSILTEFEALMDEYGDISDKLWCNIIGYKPYNVVVFEDLKEKNYKLADRRNCLDLKHGLLVMNSLGRFHGISHVLLDKGIITRDDLGIGLLESDSYISTRLIEGGVKQLAHVMATYWPLEWMNAAQRIGKEAPLVPEKIRRLYNEFPENGLMVMNHGDCWTCNMMFKYSPYEEDTPIAIKFVDYQLCHFNSYIFDVIHFIYRCIKPNIRREHISRLFTEYQTSLAKTLTFYCLPERAPTLEQILKEAERVNYITFFYTLTSMPMSSADTETPFYLDRLSSDCDSKDTYSPEPFKAEKFRLAVEEDIHKWMDEGLF